MSQRNVELFVGRLMTDEAFRERFCRNAAEAVEQLQLEGIDLSAIETEAISRINPSLARLFAEMLDPRIQRTCSGKGRP